MLEYKFGNYYWRDGFKVKIVQDMYVERKKKRGLKVDFWSINMFGIGREVGVRSRVFLEGRGG